MIPISLACTTPIVYNEYGVPISLFGGGILTINGSKYNPSQKIITYNLTVNNTNKFDSVTISFAPDNSLLNYLYGSTITIPPKWRATVGIKVFVDGLTKNGNLNVLYACGEGSQFDLGGVIFVSILGRGSSNPQACENTESSCGTYPDCEDISNKNGCYEGFYRTYYCGGNTVQFSKTCTNYCCQSFTVDGYCTGNPSYCYDPTPSCQDECTFLGTKCMDNKVYTCTKKPDGCYDLVKLDDCATKNFNCYQGQCIDGAAKIGSIAYLCSNTYCLDGLEPKLMSWLDSNNWMVVGKAFNSWDSRELADYDVILCSDELRACKVDVKYPANDLHKNYKKPFVEITDTIEAEGAWRLGYVDNPYEYLSTGNSLYLTKPDDSIFNGDENPQIFSLNKKITVVPDYSLKSVIDLADVKQDNRKSTLFKSDENENKGRYVYMGWFYQASVSDLTEEGIKILNRTLVWAACGDSCLTSSNGNRPPIAIMKITPNPMGYEGQVIQFDASDSYDPDGYNLTYYWNFGDGKNSSWISDKITTHVYNQEGEYNVTLTVNDGELNSKPSVKMLTILPTIKNKAAFICADNLCRGPTEQKIIQFLKDNGFTVANKRELSWTYDELKGYDFIVCSSSSGCNIHFNSAVYNSHVKNSKGFIEIPDYTYARAADNFNYVSSDVGSMITGKNILFVNNHSITKNLSGNIYSTNKDMNGIFTNYVKVKTIAKLIYTKDISTMFISDSEGNIGRYAYIGWFNRNSVLDLTNDGKTLFMRTIRWVQCGNVNGCT